MPVKPRRTAIYARISTDETRQNPETQLIQLRDYAAQRKFEIVGEYIDYASGRHTERVSYKKLIDTVRKRQVDVVLVFHYDRLARSPLNSSPVSRSSTVSVSILSPISSMSTPPRTSASSTLPSWLAWRSMKVPRLAGG
jgi:DNA invertase Pin-like site-specific DNA recombinase